MFFGQPEAFSDFPGDGVSPAGSVGLCGLLVRLSPALCPGGFSRGKGARIDSAVFFGWHRTRQLVEGRSLRFSGGHRSEGWPHGADGGAEGRTESASRRGGRTIPTGPAIHRHHTRKMGRSERLGGGFVVD